MKICPTCWNLQQKVTQIYADMEYCGDHATQFKNAVAFVERYFNRPDLITLTEEEIIERVKPWALKET